MRPLLAITDRLADAVEALRNVELAKALTTVLLTAQLRAYQAGARAAHRAAAVVEHVHLCLAIPPKYLQGCFKLLVGVVGPATELALVLVGLLSYSSAIRRTMAAK